MTIILNLLIINGIIKIHRNNKIANIFRLKKYKASQYTPHINDNTAINNNNF